MIASPISAAVLLAESTLAFVVARRHSLSHWSSTFISVLFVFSAFLLCKYFALKGMFALPIGISYFTFRLIHYLQEAYRQKLRQHTFPEFMAYMTFFPTFLVGPINLFPDFLVNLRRRKWDSHEFSRGLERLVYGYAQLIIIGNYLLNYLLKAWVNTNLQNTGTMTTLVIHSVQLWLDLYIRFSAYSSIAIGIAAMAGFSVPENFRYPFLASNIRDFWQRWHMSLTNWCRDYIFIPLASHSRNAFLAIVATMITIGVWHELSFRYILWGIYHALGIIFYENYARFTKGRFPDRKRLTMIRKAVGMIITLVFVIMSFPLTTIINDYIMSFVR
ncbi:MAG: MBOAT family O-acyltransferase [Bacteroidota bacterium]